MIKCHKKQADTAFKGSTVDDESCETGPNNGKSAKEKLDAAIAKVSSLCTSAELTFAAAEEATLFADKSNPLSDEDLVNKLRESGYPVARRTVTKYRKMLKIPSSRQRKEWTA